MNLCRETTCVGRGVAEITSAYPVFVEMLLRLSGDAWRAREGRTIFPAVNGKQVKALPVHLPSESDLLSFEADIAPLRRRLRVLDDQTATALSLRTALLQKLFVRVAEDELAAA